MLQIPKALLCDEFRSLIRTDIDEGLTDGMAKTTALVVKRKVIQNGKQVRSAIDLGSKIDYLSIQLSSISNTWIATMNDVTTALVVKLKVIQNGKQVRSATDLGKKIDYLSIQLAALTLDSSQRITLNDK